MKRIDFWKEAAKNESPLETAMSFRCVDHVRSIPLYGIHIYREEYEFAKDLCTKITNEYWKNRWKYAMSSDPLGFCGCPDLYELTTVTLDDIVVSATSLKCNHHYFTYNQTTGKDILEFDRIVELGGGCGDMAKFIRKMGYKNEYVIIDIPEVIKLQEFNLEGYDIALTCLKMEHKPNTLFISTWALSECPLSWRKEVLDSLRPDSYLITYQKEFEGISNEDYFSSWTGVRKDIPWIPWDGGSKYLIQ